MIHGGRTRVTLCFNFKKAIFRNKTECISMYQYMQRADIFDECADLLQWWSGDGFPGNSFQNKLDKTRMT